MSNRILHVELRDRSVVPAEACVHVTVVPERLDAGTEVLGRLMGPQCRYASTIEVAYHLRRLLVPTDRPAVVLRAIIPEASLWDPESPHLYTGRVELWQDGLRCHAVWVVHGLRHFSIGPRGLRINSRVVRLRGREVHDLDEERAVALREAGYNLLVAPGTGDPPGHLWELADRIGFVVLGRVGPHTHSATCRELANHPSCLGWLLADDAWLDTPPPGTLLGVGPGHARADRASFLAMPTEAYDPEQTDRPVLLIGRAEPGDDEQLIGVVLGG